MLVLKNKDDVNDWHSKKEDIKQRLLSYLGAFPKERAELNSKVISETNVDGILIKKVAYDAEAGDSVYAYLLIPARNGQKLPAILALHQTVPYGKDEVAGFLGSPDLDYGLELAERGYVVLAPDSLAAGDRLEHNERPWCTERFYRKHPKWSAVGKGIWDNMAALDYLESLPYVDKGRIGVIGHSQGGVYAYFLAAFDERIRAVVANCSLMSIAADPDPLRWAREGGWVGIPKLKSDLKVGNIPFDMHEVIALIAPRAFLSINATRDEIIPHYQGAIAIEQRVADVYRLFKRSGNLNVVTFSGKHSFPVEFRELAYKWLDSQLKTGIDQSLLKDIVDEMLSGYEKGKISDSSFYGSTSADSLAHYALAYLAAYQYSYEQNYLRKGLDLLDIAIQIHCLDKNSYWGWGLGETYDAFQDGTVNGKDTSYSYTTALMGKAFLEAYSLTRDARYISAAQKAAEGLVKGIGYDRTDDGICFRYSNSFYDRNLCVHNVNLYSAAFLSELNKTIKAVEYVPEINQALSHSLSRQREEGNWAYMDGGISLNDLVPLAMQVSSLVNIYENTGNMNSVKAATKALEAMNNFMTREGKLSDKGTGTAWSLGEALIAYKLVIGVGNSYVQQIMDQLLSWTICQFNQEGYIFDKNPRSQSWIAYGIASSLLVNRIRVDTAKANGL